MSEHPSVKELLASLDEETAEAVVVDLISAALFARDLELSFDPCDVTQDFLIRKYREMGIITEEHQTAELQAVLDRLIHATRETALQVLLGEEGNG